MSLKTVHIIFITASVLLALGFGGWALNHYAASGGLGYLLTGVLSLISGVVLVVYGKRFLQKLSHISYL